MAHSETEFLPHLFQDFAEIERETKACLGDESGFFVNVYNDCIDIGIAIDEAYPGPQRFNLVRHVTSGLFKEIHWFHLFFVSGNYPLLNSRLRYVWEAVYRAYFAETRSDAPPSMDEKLTWLEDLKPRPDWNTCIAYVLREVFPPAAADPAIVERYRHLWSELNQYVHPSAYVMNRMVDESSLHVRDGFDEAWARDTIAAGRDVFDLAWLAILFRHQLAIPKIARNGLIVRYPVVAAGLESFNDGEEE